MGNCRVLCDFCRIFVKLCRVCEVFLGAGLSKFDFFRFSKGFEMFSYGLGWDKAKICKTCSSAFCSSKTC